MRIIDLCKTNLKGFVAIGVLVMPSLVHAAAVRTVALADNGDTGTVGNPAFTDLDTYALDDCGAVTFYGNGSESAAGSDYWGIWRNKNGVTQLVIKGGSVVLPGMEDTSIFIKSSGWSVSNHGTVYASVDLSGTGIDSTNDTAILRANTSGISIVAQEGDELPGVSAGETFVQLGISGITADGKMIFTASDSNNKGGIWSYDSGTVTSIYRYGDSVPASMSGLKMSPWFTKVNSYGDVAFRGSLWDSEGNAIDTALFSIVDRQLKTIATNGQQAPGTEEGAMFNYIDMIFPFGTTITPIINDNGNTAIYADIYNPSDYIYDDAGIWIERDDELSLVVRKDDTATQADPEATVYDVSESDSKVLINSKDALAYSVTLRVPHIPPYTSATLNSIWINDVDSQRLIVKQGDQIPGTETNATFGRSLIPVDFTNAGQLLFHASFGATRPANSLWVADSLGELTLIVKEGDLFDVDDDELIEDLRTIEDIDYRTQMNEAGEVAVKLRFTDGSSGLFVIPTLLPGDLNADGFVGLDDLDIILNNWNQEVLPGKITLGNTNADGFVGLDDLDVVLSNWNTGIPPAVAYAIPAIPEPGAGLVVSVFAACCIRMRKRV